MSMRSVHSARTVRTNRSAYAFIREGLYVRALNRAFEFYTDSVVPEKTGAGRRGFESFEMVTPRARDLRGVSRR